MIEIDCRGLSCPLPVLRTKRAIDSNPSDDLEVIVDSAVAKENVKRLLTSSGYQIVREKPLGDGVSLVATKGKQK